MANDTQKLSIEPGQWGPDAERLLPLALQHATINEIKSQVENGASLFHVKQAGAVVAAFILRVDHTVEGSEGVIVAAAGKLKGGDLMASCMHAIESLFTGCKSIRFHTARPAVARKMAMLGYKPAEIVCTKQLENKNASIAA